MIFDGKAFGEEIVAAVKAHVENVVGPIAVRLEELTRRLDNIPTPLDKDAVTSEVSQKVLSRVDEHLRKAISEIPAAKDGIGLAGAFIDRDGDLIVTLTDGRHQKLGPVVGKSADERIILQALCGQVDERVEALKSEVEEARKRIPDIDTRIDEIARAIDALKSQPQQIDRGEVRAIIDEALPIIKEHVREEVSRIPVPKDGADGRGLASMLIDRNGELVATMTDGRTEKLGPVVGKDADIAVMDRMIADAVKALPKAKDGQDGLGFEDMTEELADDGRTVIRRYARGDHVKEFRHALNVLIDRGIFKSGQTYKTGDGVTFGGSYWIAQNETKSKPGSSDDWRIAVKKGRDGKDAK